MQAPTQPANSTAGPALDLAPFVDELRSVTRTDLAAGGLFTGGSRMTLTALSGAHSGSLRHLDIRPGHGLGGKVLALGRPMWVADYYAAKGITHHYDEPVRIEGLRAMVAVPFQLPAGAAGVMYAALRRPMAMGDRVLDRVVQVARRLETEAAVSYEVARRLADVVNATPSGPDAARDQCLRDVHAELALLRDSVSADDRLRVEALLDRIGRTMGVGACAVGGPATSPVTRRELDVLVQVATGAGNAEAAERLGLTASTVKSYLQSASRKLGARNRVEAVAVARRLSLLP